VTDRHAGRVVRWIITPQLIGKSPLRSTIEFFPLSTPPGNCVERLSSNNNTPIPANARILAGPMPFNSKCFQRTAVCGCNAPKVMLTTDQLLCKSVRELIFPPYSARFKSARGWSAGEPLLASPSLEDSLQYCTSVSLPGTCSIVLDLKTIKI
jgi:hypothetical protein